MFVRNRRGKARARLAVAAAVLAGGAAIGVVVVATNSSHAPSTVQSAAYTVNFHHRISESTALSTALSDWTRSEQKSFTALQEMAPMKSFSTVRRGKTVLAVQRGVVALATKHWLLVKSSNGSLHLWLLNGATKSANVANSANGTAAMTGSAVATTAAMQQNNMNPAAQVMGGSTGTVASLNNPAPKPATFTVTVAGAGETVTVTITSTTATVTPTTTQVAQQVTQATGTTMAKTTQPTFASSDHIKRGDLVLVAGVEKHGILFAQLVLFSAPGMTVAPTPTPTPTPTVSTATPSTSPSVSTATPTGTPSPNTSVSSTPAVNSTHS